MNIFKKGFTLVELIIVIAIIGILAAGLLVLLDPIEQINRANDAAKDSNARDAVRALDRYFAVKQAYPRNDATYNALQELMDAGEIKQLPPNVYADGPGTASRPWICFNKVSKAYNLNTNTRFEADDANRTTIPAAADATAPCTAAAVGTATNTCVKWCVQ